MVHRGVVFSSNFADQRLYRHEPGRSRRRRSRPRPTGAYRYADGRVIAGWLAADLRPRAPRGRRRRERDRVDPDGRLRRGVDRRGRPRLLLDAAHLAGRHEARVADVGPAGLPWDGSELWVADLGRRAAPCPASAWSPGRRRRNRSSSRRGVRTACCTSSPTAPAGGTCIARSTATCRPLCPMDAEFGWPQWVFGDLDVRVPRRRSHRVHLDTATARSTSRVLDPRYRRAAGPRSAVRRDRLPVHGRRGSDDRVRRRERVRTPRRWSSSTSWRGPSTC